jgi:hypothetical protein
LVGTGNPNPVDVEPFIHRWEHSGSAERANYSMFLTELCALLGVPGPQPARPDDRDNAYVFERAVPMDDGDGKITVGRIDLYKRGCFVIEAKQGSTSDNGSLLFIPPPPQRRGTAVRGTAHWDAEMKKAKGQAERYVRSLPADEGNPPFILVVDVGHVIELYADFSRLGKTYTPFPDVQSYRIHLEDLKDESIRQRLALIWTDPLSLDPARHSAKVTRKIAENLAKLARSFEAAGQHPEVVAAFLMRCLFTFFAEDVLLIDRKPDHPDEQPFTDLLKSLRKNLDQFIPMVQEVWSRMDGGGFSTAIRRKLKHFNGKLFKECHALQVTSDQLELLIDAGQSDWSDVEPAIFGTLLERALEPRERHKLGAHYTPRAYVERLVLPTVIEPLREKWDAAKAAAFTLQFQGKNEEARKAVHEFLAELCNTIVLDPACGSANFLYVTMEHMKKLEGEVRDELRQLGETQELLERGGLTVDPHQFLGLEINPRAVAIAELVLWIGYLKWHLRTLGHPPKEPLLRAFENIREQDAVLAYDRKELVTDEQGKPVSRWDGHTMRISAVTGQEVPDDKARVPVYRYVNPRKAEWPKADYVVGNPPYIGLRTVRPALDDGYIEAIRTAYPDVADHCDYVMYWWAFAALELSASRISAFGFITTKSIGQSFSRKVLEQFLDGPSPVHLSFVIPNHPWVDSADGADVRVAMTVARPGKGTGHLREVTSELPGENEREVRLSDEIGLIHPNLKIGADVTASAALRANERVCSVGVQISGRGFVIDSQRAQILSSGLDAETASSVIRPLRNARDITQQSRGALVIDTFGLELVDLREAYPAIYQWLLERVRPERLQNGEERFREKWWLHSRPREEFRASVSTIERYIATPLTAKHRIFAFVPTAVMCDSTCVVIATNDAYALGVLSSTIHVAWAVIAGGRLGVGDDPRYLKAECFDRFPFPDCTDAHASRVRALGESLDAHRKRQQALDPDLTITNMYNVLEKLRGGAELTDKDRKIHEQGLVSVLRQIHDDLDAAVADAYGWPADLTDEEILRRLVALNAQRAEEEKHGLIRWLRPDFQNPGGVSATQGTLSLPAAATSGKAKKVEKLAWPKPLAEQAHAVRAALAAAAAPSSAAQIARRFKAAKADRVGELLATLAALGQARFVGEGKFVA